MKFRMEMPKVGDKVTVITCEGGEITGTLRKFDDEYTRLVIEDSNERYCYLYIINDPIMLCTSRKFDDET